MMNERQKRFAEFYAASWNAAEAARLAGYSEKTARSQGQRLLTDVDIMRYVRQHGGAFHIWLDMLIRRYNSYHHTHIENDYCK